MAWGTTADVHRNVRFPEQSSDCTMTYDGRDYTGTKVGLLELDMCNGKAWAWANWATAGPVVGGPYGPYRQVGLYILFESRHS